MANHKSGTERYNDRMSALFENAKLLEYERLERGEMPNPSLTDPETARRYGWLIQGRDVTRLADQELRYVPDEFGIVKPPPLKTSNETPRYESDPVFRQLVDIIELALTKGAFTSVEIQEAARVAQIKFEENRQHGD